MHLFLPLLKKDKEAFRRCAILIGFDEFVLHKFVYTMQDSDVDIYQLMYDERISLLIYGWEICEVHMQNSSNAVANKNYTPTKNVQTVMKWLARYSLDLWLSREWDSCDINMSKGLLYCMRRVEHILTKIPDVGLLNWNDMFKWDVNPWSQPYVSKFLIVSSEKKQMLDQSIEEIEQPACKQDIDYLREENIFMIMARLVKMVDSFFLEGAKQLSMRVLAAWNAIFERAKDIPGNITPQIPAEFKQCVINICHIYLMTVYEMDGNRGFVIDNMMNNIRFYHQSFLERNYDKPFAAIAQLTFTPARFIALTCINLNVSMNKFIEMFSNHAAEKNFSTLFGVISQSYISYILGNQLMEMNNMNEEHFNEHIEHYKNIFNIYINEREISEMYLKDQLQRREQQRNSHSMSQIVKILTDFESKFCKGNRSCNMGNYENGSEDEYVQAADAKMVRDKNTDAIFENMPNNEEILKYVYHMLADRTYDGWHCAKIVLLLKIIGIEVNVIETWRYHPGLTTEFMLGIETKLSKHYEDLALLFHEHYFLEQEFWLTAFYLNPIRKYYAPVMRCGMRFHRILQHVDGDTETNVDSADKNEKYAKYGLLSSTIDVKEIVKIRNHDTPNADYDALSKSLSSLKLSEQTVKDLLTVTFLPRNKSFAWAVNWDELRKRCKKLLKVPQLKRRLVELNMAEANDRLKYLNINYEKYKNRPQLDYGSIEEGYENLMNFSAKEQRGKDSDDDDNDDDDDDDEEDDDEDDDEATGVRDNHLGFDEYDDDDDDEDDDIEIDKSKLKTVKRSDDDDVEIAKPSSKDIEQIIDLYSSGTRRTRARTAAALASANMSVDKLKTHEKPKNEPEPKVEKICEKTPTKLIKASKDLKSDAQTNVVKRNLKELLQERSIYSNATPGFEPFPDIWDFDAHMLQTVDKTSAVLTETENLFDKLSNVKTTSTKNVSPAELSSSLTEVLLDETTLSATEYDIHEISDLSAKENNINAEDINRQISNQEVFDKETVDKDSSDKEVAKKDNEVADKQTVDKEVVSNKIAADIEASIKQTTEKEASVKEAPIKEIEENKNNVIDLNEAEPNIEQNSNKIIDLHETELDEGEIVESKAIDLDETEQDMVEEECKEIELKEMGLLEQALTQAESKRIVSDKTEQELEIDEPENIDLDMLLNTTIIDTDIDESMEICEIPPKEISEQVEEINLTKALEDTEEDQQNVVIMLADLTEADEASQNALEVISDIVMKPDSCDAVTVADEAQEELNQEVQKFTYDDGEENSQSNDVIVTTYMDLNSETSPDVPSDSPALVSYTANEDLEMQCDTNTTVQTLEKAVIAAEKISSPAEIATLSAEEATLAKEEATLAKEEATLAAEVATLAAKEAIPASADVEVAFLGPVDVEIATIAPANIEQDISLPADVAEVIPSPSDVAEAILAPANVEESRCSAENSTNTEEHSVEPIKSNEVKEVINEPIQTETSPNSETEDKPDETNDQSTELKTQLEQGNNLKTQVENTENKDQTNTIPPETKADKEIEEDPLIETKSTNEESQASLSAETEEIKEVGQEIIATEKDITTATISAPIPDSTEIANKCETNANSVPQTEGLKENKNIIKTDATTLDVKSDVVSQEVAEEEVAEEEVAEQEVAPITRIAPKKEVAPIAIIKRACLTEESTSSSPTELLPAKRKKTKLTKNKVLSTCKEKSAEKSNDEQPLSDSMFATKDVLVRIKRLKVADCKELRQPRVFVNRVTKDSVNLDVTAVKTSTDSNAASSSFNLRPHRKIQFKRHYSQSSTTSDDDTSKNMPKLKFARKQTAKRRNVPSGRPLGRPRKLVATPRSASGLKLRISSANAPAGSSSPASTMLINENIELIHISSSSSSPEIIESSDEDLKPMPVTLNAILDPLYEEEIILCD